MQQKLATSLSLACLASEVLLLWWWYKVLTEGCLGILISSPFGKTLCVHNTPWVCGFSHAQSTWKTCSHILPCSLHVSTGKWWKDILGSFILTVTHIQIHVSASKYAWIRYFLLQLQRITCNSSPSHAAMSATIFWADSTRIKSYTKVRCCTHSFYRRATKGMPRQPSVCKCFESQVKKDKTTSQTHHSQKLQKNYCTNPTLLSVKANTNSLQMATCTAHIVLTQTAIDSLHYYGAPHWKVS